MDNMAIIYKSLGQTPLSALERFRADMRLSTDVPITYAGRLDPMAEGLLLILIGDKCKEKDQYLGLHKTYEFEILVGFSTDTFDLLGLVTKFKDVDVDNFENVENLIKKNIEESIGTYQQKYPAYSSKTIDGEQMFSLARSGKLKEKDIPTHEVEIKRINFLGRKEISGTELLKNIDTSIQKVIGDFRQSEILEKWGSEIEMENSYLIFKFEVECSGGFYVRAFTDEVSNKLSIPMTTYSIKRTRIGEFEAISK